MCFYISASPPTTTECLYQCTETPQLIYADHGSGASMDGSIYTIGVSKIGTRSPDNYGACEMLTCHVLHH